MQFLGDNPWLLIPLGILIAYIVLRLGIGALRMLATVPPDEAETAPETDDVEEFDVRYRCDICGTELRLTRMARGDDSEEDFSAPKHCREEMSLVVEADSGA